MQHMPKRQNFVAPHSQSDDFMIANSSESEEVRIKRSFKAWSEYKAQLSFLGMVKGVNSFISPHRYTSGLTLIFANREQENTTKI